MVDTKRLWLVRATALVGGLVLLRFLSEQRMISIHGPDAQMGIWYVFSAVQVAAWALGGFLTLGFASLVWSDTGTARRRVVAALFLAAWVVISIGFSTVAYYRGGSALAAAASPETSPERLTRLIDYKGIQAGYELDNRIASNPSTPTDGLRKLHAKDQLGTELCLARNSNTQADILEEMVRLEDKWIEQALATNPSYRVSGEEATAR